MPAAPSIDATAKQRIKDAMLEAARARGARIQQEVDTVARDEAGTDELRRDEVRQDEAHSQDDLWQQQQSEDMELLLDDAAERSEDNLQAMEDLDVSPRTTVEPGAAVGIGGVNYLVGLVSEDIDVDGQVWAGMSTESPLFEAAQGKKAGDSFTFRDATQKVDFVA